MKAIEFFDKIESKIKRIDEASSSDSIQDRQIAELYINDEDLRLETHQFSISTIKELVKMRKTLANLQVMNILTAVVLILSILV